MNFQTTSMAISAAIFFDRDDTIIENVPYNGDPAKVVLMPGVREALDKLQKASFILFIVSNQSGVGRGMITMEDVKRVNERMIELLGKPFFKNIYSSYAAPNDPNDLTRKPSPYFLKLAEKEYSLDLTQSWMIGDRLADIECAKNAGCKSILLPSGQDKPEERARAEKMTTHTANSILEAAEWILASHPHSFQ